MSVATANEQRLALYIQAEAKILAGQSWRLGDRFVQRADLAEVRAEIAHLQQVVAREQQVASGNRSRFSQADFGGGD